MRVPAATAGGPTCSPADDAAAALDPALHADLAGAQVWLLSWLPEQGTPLHDHGTSAGAFTVVRGTLTERVVAAGPHAASHETTADLTAGRVRHFGPHYVHQVTNTAAEPAVSVHVYTPGLAWMNTYRIDGAAAGPHRHRAGRGGLVSAPTLTRPAAPARSTTCSPRRAPGSCG